MVVVDADRARSTKGDVVPFVLHHVPERDLESEKISGGAVPTGKVDMGYSPRVQSEYANLDAPNLEDVDLERGGGGVRTQAPKGWI
jgi:hypothetical protein